MTDWLFDGVFGWLAARLASLLSWLLKVLTAGFFTSPDVTVLPQARALAERSAGVVTASFALAIVVAGVLAMTHGTLQVQYEAKDLLPRLVSGFGLSVFAVPLCRALIETANAVTVTLIGPAAAGPQVVEFVRKQMVAVVRDPAARATAAVITLVIVVLVFQLIVMWVFRFVALLLLTGLAPLALACFALPQTQQIAQLWWRSLLGTLAVPLVQGVAFSAGVDLLLNPDHSLPAMTGITPSMPGSSGTTVLNLFTAACLLMVTVRVPRLVTRFFHQGGGPGLGSVVVRTVLVQTVLRPLRVARFARLSR